MFKAPILLLLSGLLTSAQTVRAPLFVSPEQLPVASVLPNPPTEAQTAAELVEVHRIENTRSPQEIAQAKADDAEEDIFIFKNILGEKFTPAALPLTAKLSAHVHGDEGLIVNPAKNYFRRLRPFNFDKSLHPVCKVKEDPTDFSYPSGHSVTGYLEAMVLTLLVPERRDAIFARADEYSHNRVVCGVHYPSDTVASKPVAYAMMGVLMTNPQFQKELEAARTELRQFLGL